jgi:hypothetical protein
MKVFSREKDRIRDYGPAGPARRDSTEERKVFQINGRRWDCSAGTKVVEILNDRVCRRMFIQGKQSHRCIKGFRMTVGGGRLCRLQGLGFFEIAALTEGGGTTGMKREYAFCSGVCSRAVQAGLSAEASLGQHKACEEGQDEKQRNG